MPTRSLGPPIERDLGGPTEPTTTTMTTTTGTTTTCCCCCFQPPLRLCEPRRADSPCASARSLPERVLSSRYRDTTLAPLLRPGLWLISRHSHRLIFSTTRRPGRPHTRAPANPGRRCPIGVVAAAAAFHAGAVMLPHSDPPSPFPSQLPHPSPRGP